MKYNKQAPKLFKLRRFLDRQLGVLMPRLASVKRPIVNILGSIEVS